MMKILLVLFLTVGIWTEIGAIDPITPISTASVTNVTYYGYNTQRLVKSDVQVNFSENDLFQLGLPNAVYICDQLEITKVITKPVNKIMAKANSPLCGYIPGAGQTRGYSATIATTTFTMKTTVYFVKRDKFNSITVNKYMPKIGNTSKSLHDLQWVVTETVN